MFRLNEAQQLWGYRPLYLFMTGWAALVLLIAPRFSKKVQNWRWLGLSTLSGILLAISFPATLLPMPWMLFIAFVPLLMVEHELTKSNEKGSWKLVLKYSYNTFVIWNILATYWVTNSALVAGMVAIWLNAFFMAVPFVAFHLVRKYLPRFPYLPFVVFWLSFEFLHLNWEISWPWLTLGNAFAEFPSWIQWYSFTGALGGSLWVLLLNILIFRIVDKFWLKKEKANARRLIQIGLLFLSPLIISVWMYYSYENKGEKAEVVVIQPNFEPHYEKFTYSQTEQLERFLNLSLGNLTEQTEFLVFPETSFRHIETNGFDTSTIIQRLKAFLNKYPNLKLITGLSAHHVFASGESHTNATREFVTNEGDTIYWEALNIAVQIEANKREIPIYIKSKLVPGAELTPYRKVFFFIKPLIDKLGGSLAGHGVQEERSVLESPTAKVAPMICYESIYGGYSTGYVQKGANAIFIMTNDGWWDNTAGHRQHLNYASLRAIEARRSIARSANTGISAFINQRGDIRQTTKYGVEAVVKDEIQLNEEITFYARWGDYIGRLAALLTVLVLLNVIVKKLSGKGI